MSTLLDPREFEANTEFFRQATIPIMTESPLPAVLGGGVLFRRGDRMFLVTAAHVAERLAKEELGLPSRSAGVVWTVGRGKLGLLSSEREDVGVFRFDQRETIEKLTSGYWTVLDDSNVLSGRAASDTFWIFGHPTLLPGGGVPLNAAGEVSPQPFLIRTEQYDGPTDHVTSSAIPHECHDLFAFPNKDSDLKGISGSPVWVEVPEQPHAVWTPSARFKLVGVEIDVIRGSWIRATKWRYVSKVIDSLLTT